MTQAIADIQGSIHANDSKSAAGLVVQGLLTTAVVTVVTHLGTVYGDGSPGARTAIKILLAAVVVTALVSILYLVRAIYPYNPRLISRRLKEREAHPYREIFFPDIKEIREAAQDADAFEGFTSSFEANVKALRDNPDEVTREYVAELLKVADIRAHEADQAKVGFVFLGLEVFLVAAYLVVAGCIAGQILGFDAAASSGPPSLHWTVKDGGVKRVVGKRARLVVRPEKSLTVRVAVGAHQVNVTRVRLTRRTTLRCVRHGRVRNVLAGPPSVQKIRSPGKNAGLGARIHVQHRHCPFEFRYAGFAELFLAEADTVGGDRAAGRLILQGPIHPSGI
ncbi:MAG TPA: hypothetical protein VG448_03625 [Solirubrobacterales bacterium]|nr:hypothetical protein [Solirubrobacterales bacterium]